MRRLYKNAQKYAEISQYGASMVQGSAIIAQASAMRLFAATQLIYCDNDSRRFQTRAYRWSAAVQPNP
jgi:hypothetical protein